MSVRFFDMDPETVKGDFCLLDKTHHLITGVITLDKYRAAVAVKQQQVDEVNLFFSTVNLVADTRDTQNPQLN